MALTQPFPRGFLLTRADSAAVPPPGWATLELPGADWAFHHDPLEQPELRFTPDGSQWVLTHGMCLVSDPDSATSDAAQYVVDHLAVSQTQFLEALDLLGGRHIILRGGPEGIALFHDAMGMRSVYFSAESSVAASHEALLQATFPHTKRSTSSEAGPVGAMWSQTGYHGIDALLPNHSVELGTWSVERFFPRAENRYTGLTLEQKVRLFRRIWDRQLQELEATGADLVFSLTGGADSRTVLALSWPSRERFRMFTYTVRDVSFGKKSWAKSLELDRRIVDQLLTVLPGASHSYFYADDERPVLSPEAARAVRLNTTRGHGKWLLPYYLQTFDGQNVVHMRGVGFEIGQAVWGPLPDNDDNAAVQKKSRFLLKRARAAKDEDYQDEYFWDGAERWGYNQELHGFHRLDLAYWEVRMGRWSADVNNETDVAFNTWVGVSVRALFEISLSMSLEDRRSSLLFAELINDAYPLLNFFGKNDVRNLYEQQRGAARKAAPAAIEQVSEAPVTGLTDGLHLMTASVRTVIPEEDQALLHIPQEHFARGTRASRIFEQRTESGDLRFTLTSAYGKPASAKNFMYQIRVNDRLMVSWDGGISSAPVHVTVADLRNGDQVSVSAVPLTDRRQTTSWSAASRAWIEEVTFEAKAAEHPSSVAVDAPHATSRSRISLRSAVINAPSRTIAPFLKGIFRP